MTDNQTTDDLTENTANPASDYATPAQLAGDSALSLAERRALLDEWEDDVRLRAVAAEEGMTRRGEVVDLADILAAKAMLPIDTPARDSPTKA